jgi:hypothetical protein
LEFFGYFVDYGCGTKNTKWWRGNNDKRMDGMGVEPTVTTWNLIPNDRDKPVGGPIFTTVGTNKG